MEWCNLLTPLGLSNILMDFGSETISHIFHGGRTHPYLIQTRRTTQFRVAAATWKPKSRYQWVTHSMGHFTNRRAFLVVSNYKIDPSVFQGWWFWRVLTRFDPKSVVCILIILLFLTAFFVPMVPLPSQVDRNHSAWARLSEASWSIAQSSFLTDEIATPKQIEK